MGKTNPLNDADMKEFVTLQKLALNGDEGKAIGEKSWFIDIADVQTHNYDLSVKNPNKKEVAALRQPQAILQEIYAGIDNAADGKVHVEVDRVLAIEFAIRKASAKDVVLLAGKGHEDYQDIMGVKKPFSDLEQARAALQARGTDMGGAA